MSDAEPTRPPGAVVRIDIYSHHVRVTNFGQNVLMALYEFCKTIAQYGPVKQGNRFVRAMTKVYVGVTNDRSAFSFHINDFDRLKRHLANCGIPYHQMWIIEHEVYDPSRYVMNYIDERIPRGVQPDAIDYITGPGRIKLVPLDPGAGKTFITLKSLETLEVRAFFCIKPMYIEKWIKDIEEAFDAAENEIMVVKGTANFKKMLALAEADELDAKIILCSNGTYFQYLKYYERYKEELLNLGFACLPWQMHEMMDNGIRVIDEVHQDFHLNFRQDLYSHVPLTLGLSGSISHDDPFINNRNEVMFPPSQRFQKQDRVVHVAAQALMYETPDIDQRFNYTNKQLKSYAHVLYEKSLRKKKKNLKAYFQMCQEILSDRFIARRKEGEKAIVFFATKDMCTDFVEYLKERHPDEKIQRYIGEDDYNEMLEAEIIVSTLKSLGTAIDVPGLRTVLKTDALSSLQGNVQVLGRIRPLKSGETPEFLYLVNVDISKHVEYMEKKMKIFRGRVVKHDSVHTGYVI